MSRTLSVDLLAQATSKNCKPVLLSELFCASSTLRLWSGYGDIVYDGNTYVGSGLLGTISQVEDTSETKSVNLTLQLTGIPSAMISLAFDNTEYKGRRYNLYLGFLSYDNEQIETFGGEALETFGGEQINIFSTTKEGVWGAIKIFSGIMDMMTIEDDAETATISLNVENRLVGLLKSKTLRYTNEEQKKLYPNDRGLEYITAIQGSNTPWGRAK